MRAIYLMKNSSTFHGTAFHLNDNLQRGQCCSTELRTPMKTCPGCCWKLGILSPIHTALLKKNLTQTKIQTQKLQISHLILILACHFKSRQVICAALLMEIWCQGALGRSILQQISETSSGGTPHHHVSHISSEHEKAQIHLHDPMWWKDTLRRIF